MSESNVPAEAQFDLILSEQLQGEPVLDNPSCHFSYHWNFETGMGLAQLHSINGSPVNITLHPLGIAGELDFMSDMEPTSYVVNASNDDSIALIEIVIYRVILDIDLKSGDRKAAIMFNRDGSSIEASRGFNEAGVERSLPVAG